MTRLISFHCYNFSAVFCVRRRQRRGVPSFLNFLQATVHQLESYDPPAGRSFRYGNLGAEIESGIAYFGPRMTRVYDVLSRSIVILTKRYHLKGFLRRFQTREDWKYVAMVIDRLQLYIFFLVTTAGTIGILMDAPHIFEYVDQDRIIEIYRGK